MILIGPDQWLGALLFALGASLLIHAGTKPAVAGRDVHREWRDGMLAQGRPVAPERMAWDRLSRQDRELDERIAAAITRAVNRHPVRWARLAGGLVIVILSVLVIADVVRLGAWLFPPGPGVP